MSDVPPPQPPATPPPSAPPARRPPPPPPVGLSGCFLGISLLLNFLALVVIFVLCVGISALSSASHLGEDSPLSETYHSGSKTAKDKIAIVHVEGILMEGLLHYPKKQLAKAAEDKSVKAVVLRVNSPGGTITSSEDLHRRILRLKDGDKDRELPAKPLVVSMGALAASGGYYISAPAGKIFAERTTLTGSIGVYLSLPNVVEFTDKYGIKVNTIKAGEIKAAGSAFAKLTPKEEQVLQDMVDESYQRFLEVVEKGRPKLTRALLLDRFKVKPLRVDPLIEKKADPYSRYRADGGTFSGLKAKELGLVDDIGTLDDSVKAAAELAKLDEGSWRAIKYSKPKSVTDLLMGANVKGTLPDLAHLEAALTPRVWYLAPGHETAALAAAARAGR